MIGSCNPSGDLAFLQSGLLWNTDPIWCSYPQSQQMQLAAEIHDAPSQQYVRLQIAWKPCQLPPFAVPINSSPSSVESSHVWQIFGHTVDLQASFANLSCTSSSSLRLCFHRLSHVSHHVTNVCAVCAPAAALTQALPGLAVQHM